MRPQRTKIMDLKKQFYFYWNLLHVENSIGNWRRKQDDVPIDIQPQKYSTYKIVVIIIIVKVVIKLAIIIIWYYLQPSQFKNRFINLHPHDLEDYKKRFFHRKNLKASF